MRTFRNSSRLLRGGCTWSWGSTWSRWGMYLVPGGCTCPEGTWYHGGCTYRWIYLVLGGGGCTWSQGVYLPGGVPGPGAMYLAPGGTWSWGGVPGARGVYLPGGGVPGPRGGCTGPRGCTWSWRCTWSWEEDVPA